MINFKRKWLFITVMCVVLSAVTHISAQEPQKTMGMGHGKRNSERESFHRKQPRDHKKAHEMMMSMKIWKLTEALEIDEQLAEKLYPRVRDLEKFRYESKYELSKQIQQLQTLMDTENYDKDQLKLLVDSLMQKRLENNRLEEEKLNSIISLLSVEQQAKFILVEEEFHQDLRRFLKERRGRKGK